MATGEPAARDLDWQMRHTLEDMVRSAWQARSKRWLRRNSLRHDRSMTSITDLFSLDGKVAVVTGASSGLGVAFAEAFAEAGADVALGARRVDRLADTAELVEQAGRSAISVETDVASPEACQALVDAAMQELGRVDVLINNAGIGTAVPATREKPEEFRRVIDVNLNGCYWMAQACGRVMEPGSSIINISSVLGLTTAGLPQAAYAASKAGLIGLTRDLAQQWTGRKGIRVNAIAPGFFASEMTDSVPRGLPREPAGPDPRRTQGRPARAGRNRGVPRLRRGRLHHRPDAAGGRRDDDHLMPRPSITIIGAGFGGLGTAIELRRAGYTDITILERADGVGGVWRDNTYPNAACDVPSSLYSWSFAPNPGWPHRYSRQDEILGYIRRTARELGALDLCAPASRSPLRRTTRAPAPGT